jgi:hypothetical protein
MAATAAKRIAQGKPVRFALPETSPGGHARAHGE